MPSLQRKPRNKFEVKLFAQLKRRRVKFQYESEKLPYVISGHYIPDFVINTPLGKVYIEAKGYLRPEHKRKLVAVKKQHPELDLRILFYAAKKKDIKWADRQGFKWAVQDIPIEWIKGL